MSPGSRFGRDRSAFTLIELMAVLVLVGLVSATAMLRFGATTHRAQFEWSLERVMAADRLLRTHSVTCGQPGHLEFEIGTGRLERVFGAKRDAAPPVELGAKFRITRFLAGQRHGETGKVEVAYSPEGHSETFAIEIEGPGDQSAWILFAGLTGQTRRLEDRRDVERILEVLRPAGPDAG
jgi:prepilin-type N-terminal cleavage/methylation domain-containing protein